MNPRLVKQTAVITGTTHGIGRVTSRELARAGYRVVMLCRNVAAAEQVCAEFTQRISGAELEVIHCDLSSLASVAQAANTVLARHQRIDLLINNAGTVNVRHRMSVDGFELTFAVNHLGPYLLTRQLLPHLKANSRIINIASAAHYRAEWDVDRLTNPKARYRSVAAYDQSKLANVLHTFALARRLKDTSITANCLHPGIVASNLLPAWLRLIKPLWTPVTFNNERGAQTTLRLALSPELANYNGDYFDEYAALQSASPLALNIELQEELWSLSEEWTQAFSALKPAKTSS